jgi:hypothetical protein
LVHDPKGSYQRRKTDGAIASSHYEAAAIEAAERGITTSQLLTTQRYKWITLAEMTPPVQPVEPAPIPDPVPPTIKSGPSSARDASEARDLRSPPKSGFDTTQTIHNAHYERPNMMTAQISIGFVLIVLGIVFAVLAGLPILLSLGCAAIGGTMLMSGISNRRKSQ